MQYERFNLTNDFAAYSQAWTAIAHGHLDPSGTLWAFPFWRNDLELLMWPLALFYWIYPHTLTLLWLQDLAVVGGELVAVMWVRDINKTRREHELGTPWLLAFVSALLLLTPWSWYTVGFDFHFEAFVALFALLAARDIWAGRHRRGLMLWVPLTLISAAAAGGLLVVGVGIAAFLSRGKSRRVAGAVIAIGVAWLVLAGALGAMRFGGLHMSAMYGYLSGNPKGEYGFAKVVKGVLTNPVLALNMFRSNASYVAGYIASAGIIGLWSRWGLLVAGVVMVPSAINADPDFIRYAQAFQSWPAVLFLVVAYALVMHRLAAKANSPRRVVSVFGICTLVVAGTISGLFVRGIPRYIARKSSRG